MLKLNPYGILIAALGRCSQKTYLVLQQGLFKATQPFSNRNDERKRFSGACARVDGNILVARECRNDSLLDWRWRFEAELCQEIKRGFGQCLNAAEAFRSHVPTGRRWQPVCQPAPQGVSVSVCTREELAVL